MPSTKSKRFHPFSLDAIDFLLADVRGALGARVRTHSRHEGGDLRPVRDGGRARESRKTRSNAAILAKRG